jgi:large subunit ribosomal protein L7/L12
MGIFGDGGSRDDYLQLEARVASLEAMVAQLAGTVAALSAPGRTPVPGAPSVPVAAQRWELEARILKQAGKLIDAIKVVREATGWGLKESKDFVDRM